MTWEPDDYADPDMGAVGDGLRRVWPCGCWARVWDTHASDQPRIRYGWAAYRPPYRPARRGGLVATSYAPTLAEAQAAAEQATVAGGAR